MHDADERYEGDPDEIRPGDSDYDLTEEHGCTWEPKRPGWPPRWLIAAVTALVIAALILPAIILILNRG